MKMMNEHKAYQPPNNSTHVFHQHQQIQCVVEVVSAFCKIVPNFITWPNGCLKAASSAAFQNKCGICNIIGAIDGCHIKIQRPTTRGGDYLNRKNYYSVILQGIVDESGRFMDIFVGTPGKVHDARVLRKSPFFETWPERMERKKLLGDSAYIGQAYPFILTPKRDNGALSVEDEQNNSRISRGRVVVEQAFYRLKCKWRRLRDLQNTRLDVVVMSACMLHNMCMGPSDICNEHPHGCPRQEDENL
ncbi:hypothetical protein ACEWY4_021575 [Coilia grayii]|uniref:DDE Tnp4 domain-containing protein n=1 Tax=Coilia grayii TaxID=363190 RepID=A0ABD1J9L3_9TELE